MIVDTNFDNIEDYPRQRSDFSLEFFSTILDSRSNLS